MEIMVVKEKKPRTKKVKAMFSREKIIAEDTSEARSLYDQSRFGELQEGKFYYSLVEGLYLIEKKKIEVEDGKKKEIKNR